MNLLDYLNIQIEEENKEQVILTMIVEDCHKQPYGVLHGGINGVLIETATSMAAMQNKPSETDYVVGIDLQVNHLKPVTSGSLRTIATPNHIGRTTQVWEAVVLDENEKKVAVGRCTLLNKKS
ncbi:PaaI family thioesterase [Vagococcus hydrophili]|uniref:Hotdog fold thioesterase n=1 Tax=Vagococcus hydrophili TaxID=2714947 RepID=A0A6G8AW97_9ENTE|nr:hotdog fold thioesterase [Vagococcus hydrophili]QIL49250.1 hotdog fold thioesterase [Vagococcus hydrophili]